jgi:flagellar hook assembly protein FlgD
MNNVIDVNQREQTVIQVDMAEAGFLNVYVMTLDGNIVQQLEHGHISAGSHYYRWDGSNTGGSSVARGLYFVRVVGSGIDETRKVLCVKD